jgi:hypothetical protein
MDKSLIALIVSISSAVFTSISLFINLRKHRIDTRHKLVVEFYYDTIFTPTEDPGTADADDVFVVSVTNHSMNAKVVEHPPLLFDKNGKWIGLIQPDRAIDYPYKLGYGEQLNVNYHAENQLIYMAERKVAGKVRVLIRDTMGKRYYSKWLNIDALA